MIRSARDYEGGSQDREEQNGGRGPLSLPLPRRADGVRNVVAVSTMSSHKDEFTEAQRAKVHVRRQENANAPLYSDCVLRKRGNFACN